MSAPETTPAERHMGEGLAVTQAITLIDEINEREPSRVFYGINQTLHAKLCTIRATLARETRLAATPTALPSAEDSLREALRETCDALENLLSADPDMPTYQADYDEAERQLEKSRAALQSPRASDEVPAGMVLVPSEPTEAMIEAASEAFPRSARFVFPKIWEAMLRAVDHSKQERA